MSQDQETDRTVRQAVSAQAESAALSGNSAGYADFRDFAARNNYQLMPGMQVPQEEMESYDGPDMDRITALYAAQNIDHLHADSVGLNQTLNTGIVTLAEADPADPSCGQVHYIAFVQSSAGARTYVFNEEITVNPDGTISAAMDEGQSWEMSQTDEQLAYGKLLDRFGEVEETSAEFRDYARANGIAVGGTDSRVGEYEIEHGDGQASLASATEINGTTAVEVVSAYSRSGQGQMLMRVFRESAEGIMAPAAEAAAPNPENTRNLYEPYSSMPSGIDTLDP